MTSSWPFEYVEVAGWGTDVYQEGAERFQERWGECAERYQETAASPEDRIFRREDEM